MSSDFNYNFGFVVGEIFELWHAIKVVLWLRSQLSDNFYKNWSLNPVRVFHICPEMRYNSTWCFAFVLDEFSWLRHTIRTSPHGHGCSKKLDTQQPLKWSLKPSKSISAFRALVKHQVSFCNVLVLHKLYKLCVTHGHAKNYIPSSQKFFSFSHQNSIWICWDVGVKIASDFQTSGLYNCLGKIA